MWRPELVARWLLDRQPTASGQITGVQIRSGLKKFPGCEQLADELLLKE